jgi:phenylacetate-CoA ligase
MFATPMAKDVVRMHASSGTTGKPHRGRLHQGRHRALGRGHGALDARRRRSCDDIILNSYGYGLFTGGLGAHYGGEALGATVIPMGGGNTEKQIQLIQEFRPTVIMATPSYMLTLADDDAAHGHRSLGDHAARGHVRRRAVDQPDARRDRARLGIDAIDVYGLSEVMGPGVACECVETKDGPHIWEDHFYPEIIDPSHRRGAARRRDGGELVFTSLTKEAMPVIRYRTRDLTRLLPGTAARCGASTRSPGAATTC